MSDIKKIREYKKARQPKREISEKEHKRNVDDIFVLLSPIVEKMEKLPAVPVAETLDTLWNELKNGVKRQPTIVQLHDGRRVQAIDSGELIEIEKPSDFRAEATKNESGEVTQNDSSINTETYTLEEIAILDSLKNA